jgi:hypothetical protein
MWIDLYYANVVVQCIVNNNTFSSLKYELCLVRVPGSILSSHLHPSQLHTLWPWQTIIIASILLHLWTTNEYMRIWGLITKFIRSPGIGCHSFFFSQHNLIMHTVSQHRSQRQENHSMQSFVLWEIIQFWWPRAVAWEHTGIIVYVTGLMKYIFDIQQISLWSS